LQALLRPQIVAYYYMMSVIRSNLFNLSPSNNGEHLAAVIVVAEGCNSCEDIAELYKDTNY
jgi:hypothetical protein